MEACRVPGGTSSPVLEVTTSGKDQWKTKNASACHRLQTDLFLKMTPGNFPFDCRKEVWTDPKALRNYEVDLGRI